MGINEMDKSVIRTVIEQQIEAFGRDDETQAFALASPGIQIQFSTPQNFVAMVKAAYYPIYRPRAVLFDKLMMVEGFPSQSVFLMDDQGELCRGIYLMQKQLNGAWRIHGCCLLPLDELITQ